jgi:hypothetical protein
MAERIELTVLSTAHVDEFLSAWNAKGEIVGRGQLPPDNPLRRYLTRNANPHPLRAILASVRRRWNAIILREYPYLDLEFWDSHAGFYEFCFHPYPVECARLHFFSFDPESNAALQSDALETIGQQIQEAIIHGKPWPEVKRALGNRVCYRGYSILRPIESFVVSRTAISCLEGAGNLGRQLCEGLREHGGEIDGWQRLTTLEELRRVPEPIAGHQDLDSVEREALELRYAGARVVEVEPGDATPGGGDLVLLERVQDLGGDRVDDIRVVVRVGHRGGEQHAEPEAAGGQVQDPRGQEALLGKALHVVANGLRDGLVTVVSFGIDEVEVEEGAVGTQPGVGAAAPLLEHAEEGEAVGALVRELGEVGGETLVRTGFAVVGTELGRGDGGGDRDAEPLLWL